MTYYDAVNVMALAMLAAKSTSPAVFNKDVMTVTAPGPGKTVVTSFAAGKAALAAGKQIQYVGAGGPIVFDQWHNSTGAFEAAKVREWESRAGRLGIGGSDSGDQPVTGA